MNHIQYAYIQSTFTISFLDTYRYFTSLQRITFITNTKPLPVTNHQSLLNTVHWSHFAVYHSLRMGACCGSGSQTCRIVFVGLDNAGKSSILDCLADGRPPMVTKPTIGYRQKTIHRHKIELQIWYPLHYRLSASVHVSLCFLTATR